MLQELIVTASAFTVVVLAAAFAWGKFWLGPYLTAKGSNLAQKEDIQELTSKVEGIKVQYTKDVESLKSTLDRRNTIHRIQFETEFSVYREAHTLAHNGVATYIRAFPSENFPKEPFKIAPAEFKTAFFAAQLDLSLFIERNAPFFTQKILKRFSKLEGLFVDQKQYLADPTPPTPEERREHRRAINSAFQECGKAIRNRLSTILVE